MPEAIKKSDIIEGKILDGFIHELEEVTKLQTVFNNNLKESAKLTKGGLLSGKNDSSASIAESNRLTKEANDLLKQKHLLDKNAIDLQKQLEQLQREKIKTQNAVNKEAEKELKTTEKLTRATERQASAYSKINDKLGKTRQEYRDLAIKKELLNNLSAKEEIRLLTLEKRVGLYDGALKKVDATMGLHHRNVGNYASGFNGLSNSVNQLTREMPAFGNSMQTGFMAISNNLPIFFDEISKIKKANLDLVATGQPTTSVLKQVASSVFSLGTALSVGVTLLTVYGAKIVDWLFNSKEQNKELERQQEIKKRLNDESDRHNKYIGDETSKYTGLIYQLKQTNVNSKERATLINQINDQYGTTLKNLSDEKAFQNQLNNSLANYIEMKRAEYTMMRNDEKLKAVQMKQEENTIKLKKEQLSLEESIEARKKYTAQQGLPAESGRDLMIALELQYKIVSDLKKNDEYFERRRRELAGSDLKLNEFIDGSGFNENSKTTKIKKEKDEKEVQQVRRQAQLINDIKNEYDWQYLLDDIERTRQIHYESFMNEIEYEAQIQQLKVLEAKHTGEELKKYEKEIQLDMLNTKIEFLKRQGGYESEIVKLQIEYQQLLQDEQKKTVDKQKVNLKDYAGMVKFSADYFIAESNRKIAQLDKEIQAHEKTYDTLKGLAVSGNIDAKESLAVEQNAIVKANQEKAKEAKKQARIKLIEAGFNAYANNGSVVKTITDLSVLNQALSTIIPAFLEGTEDTGTNGNGVDGKGGFHAILHPNERVMTKEQNAMLGGLKNDEVAETIAKVRSGETVNLKGGATAINTNWQNLALISKIDELTNVIKNKPETNIQLGEITQHAMTIVEEKRQGNTVIRNKYRVG